MEFAPQLLPMHFSSVERCFNRNLAIEISWSYVSCQVQLK